LTRGEAGPAWSAPELRDPRYSQSLERGLAILGVFSPTRPVLGIANIADHLGMNRSTTHRYVTTLVALGYLEQDASQKYRLGLRVTDLGMAALLSTGLREHAHPYLKGLRPRGPYATSLGVLDGGEVLYIDRLHSFRRRRGEIELNLHTGSRVPVHCTAMGKLLLANLPEPEQRALLARLKLTRRTAHTITTKTALREQLKEIRGTGFAVSNQELAADRVAIAAPVHDASREVIAAVSVAAHASQISLEELVDALILHLQTTAEQISARLGYRRADEILRGR
jgi:IclR family pca regulon transcriptional regulator